jgi:hypothetical protein
MIVVGGIISNGKGGKVMVELFTNKEMATIIRSFTDKGWTVRFINHPKSKANHLRIWK